VLVLPKIPNVFVSMNPNMFKITGWPKKTALLRFFEQFFAKKNFFQNDPVGGFLCEESFARIEKSSKSFLDHEIFKNLKKVKNTDFFNDFMVKKAF